MVGITFMAFIIFMGDTAAMMSQTLAKDVDVTCAINGKKSRQLNKTLMRIDNVESQL